MGVGLSQGENEFSFALAGGFSSKDEPDLLEKALRMEALHRLVHRLEAECKDFLFKIGYSSIPDLLIQLGVGAVDILNLADVQEHLCLKTPKLDGKPFVIYLQRRFHIGKAFVERIIKEVPSSAHSQTESLGEACGLASFILTDLQQFGGAGLDPAFHALILVVVEHQGAFPLGAVYIAEGRLLYRSIPIEVEELEVIDTAE
ncbi:hypothetical protein SDC9_171180 [bioreactor metagenome]|uniref:Uncharacterized protein n=1 Tax=bioreactor metagenome TaxID=1076179 RepID=A0A645GA50_9ZZZZ